MPNYKEIKEFGLVHDKINLSKQLNNVLMDGFYRVERKKSFSNKNNNESQININKSIQKFNKAKEKIKQEIVSSDKYQDDAIIAEAINNFKNTNE